MKRMDKSEVDEAKRDDIELRKFIKEISLKLRRARSRDDNDLSLLDKVLSN
jgi:hypothetical protein